MQRNDAVWYAALALMLLGISDLRAQTDEERAKQSYEQLQGGAVGKGGTKGGTVQGQPGSKEFKGSMSDPKKLSPDGTEVPRTGSSAPDPKKDGTSPGAMALKVGAAGAIMGAGIGAFFGPGALVGAAVGGVGGLIVGYGMGKLGQWMDNQSKANTEAFNRKTGGS